MTWPGRRWRSTSSMRRAEEVQAHERGLAALPGDRDALREVGLEELADVLLEHAVLHAEALSG